jgi:plastocyanin
VAGILVAVVVVAAVASIGYFQLKVAPSADCPGGYIATATPPCIWTTTSAGAIACGPTNCVNVTIPSGAATGPGYAPATVTVVIGVNATVVWTNADSTFHTVTSDTTGLFGSTTMQPGDVYTLNFTSIGPGTYHYHCIFHTPMHGTVIVKPKSS